jgi:hypothetical protein
MGTSGAYGGSSAGRWRDARDRFADLGGGPTSGPPGEGDSGRADRGQPSQAPPSGGDASGPPADDVAAAAAALAAALLGDDPDARRPSVTFPLSALLPRRGSAGGGGAGGAGGSGGDGAGRSRTGGRAGTGSHRGVVRGAARGAAAIGGAYALRAGDTAGLRDLGLDLNELATLPPRTQCARILDAILGDAGHPDDYALRRATAEHLKSVLLAETPPAPEDTIRGFIGEWIFQLSLVELRAQAAAGRLVPQQAARAERRLRGWLSRRVRGVSLPRLGRLSVQRFADIAARVAAEALRLLRAGRS